VYEEACVTAKVWLNQWHAFACYILHAELHRGEGEDSTRIVKNKVICLVRVPMTVTKESIFGFVRTSYFGKSKEGHFGPMFRLFVPGVTGNQHALRCVDP
jgi:hypothetical protein